MKYGYITGKKYGYKTDFGEWDKKFTMGELEEYMRAPTKLIVCYQ